jgi:hypothetical protein
MSTPVTRPALFADTPEQANTLDRLTLFTQARLWKRAGIEAAAVATSRMVYGPEGFTPTDGLCGHVRVEIPQRTGGLTLVLDDPDASDDLAAALTWAATRLRELLTTGQPRPDGRPIIDRRVFGPAHPTTHALLDEEDR